MTAAWTGVLLLKLNFGDFRMAKVCLRREGSSSANGGPSATRDVVVIAFHTRYVVYLSRAREKGRQDGKKKRLGKIVSNGTQNIQQSTTILHRIYPLFSVLFLQVNTSL